MPWPDETEADISSNPTQGSKNTACAKIYAKFLSSLLLLGIPGLWKPPFFIPEEAH